MARHTPGNYVPLDVNYPRDVAIRAAGEAAELLFVRGLAYCKASKTDGFVPEYDLPVVAVGLRSPQKRVAALVAHRLWVRVEGGWRVRSWEKWNKPVSREEAFIEGQSQHGTKGNHERWHTARGVSDPTCSWCSDPNRVADRVADSPSDRAPESPIREGKGREELTTSSSKLDATDDRFDEFWRQYPRKQAKADARKAWGQVTKKTDPQTVIDGLTSYAFSPDAQFRPLAASWLRGRRWEDEGATVHPLRATADMTPVQRAAAEGRPYRPWIDY